METVWIALWARREYKLNHSLDGFQVIGVFSTFDNLKSFVEDNAFPTAPLKWSEHRKGSDGELHITQYARQSSFAPLPQAFIAMKTTVDYHHGRNHHE